MNLAKVSTTRQITVPIDICRLLDLKPGDKMLFARNNRDEIVVSNASTVAIKNAQAAFRDSAEELGVRNDEDVMNIVREVRYGEFVH